MNRQLRRFYFVLGLSAAVAGIVFLTLIQPILSTRADFSVYNGDWNGATEVGRGLHGTGAFNPIFDVSRESDRVTILPAGFESSSIANPASATVVVLGPRTSYSESERAWLRDFVVRGGTLLVADDFGTGNEVLTAVTATSRIEPARVLDFAFAKKPEFVVSLDFAPHPLTDGVERALLNYPAAIVPGEGAQILANTTDAAWLDRDGDGLRDANEQAGPFAWLAVERIGAGTVVVLSDPSVLINGMRPFADNARLAANFVAFLSSGRTAIVVDESHRDVPDPLLFVGLRVGKAGAVGQAFVAAAVVGIALAAVVGPPKRGLTALRGLLERLLGAPPADAAPPPLLDRVRARHPDWDESTLREILDGWRVEDR